MNNGTRDNNESDDFMADVLSAITDAIIATDLNGTVTFFNRGAEKLFGCAGKGALGTSISRFCPQWLIAEQKELLEHVKRAGAAGPLETQRVTADGELIPVEISIGRRTDAEGSLVGFAAIIRDIRKRKQAEQALRESERDLNRAQRIAQTGSWRFDLNTGIATASDQTRRIYGLDAEEIGIRKVQAIPLTKYRAKLDEELHALIEDGKPYDIEFEICRPSDKAIRHIHSMAEYDADRNIVFGILQDITDRKEAEAKLLDSQIRHSLALDAVNLGTWDWHIPSGRMVINELWATVKGYDPSEIEPHVGSWEKLVHPEDLPVALRLHADHFAGRTDMYEATIRMRHKSGRWLWFSDKGRVVERDEAGNAIRACGTHQDITEARRLSERLRQAEKMESIGTLAGGIAHDFNNILGGIIGFADLGLNDAPPGSRLERYLNRILQGGNRARSLVKQILNFSRRSKEEKSPQYLRPIIKEVAELLRASLPSTIRIESRIDPDTRPVFADPTKIHEIVMNLCTNASQAMERETGILRISCEESSFDHEIVGRSGTVPAGMYSVITVQDNGCGMDTETVERLFEPFFTTKPEGEGTGMGMAVVFGIVQSHGGTVTVDSTVGEGTTVRVYLPKCIEEQSGEVVEALPVQGGNEKVLYIDDEEMMGELAKDMLSNLGYRVTVHVDGEAALEDFRRQPADFDIVITDQTMPVLPGMHMAREVRQIRSDIPVILCTGFSRQVNEQQAIAAGIDGFLSKPFRLREMAREIRYVLQQRKAC